MSFLWKNGSSLNNSHLPNFLLHMWSLDAAHGGWKSPQQQRSPHIKRLLLAPVNLKVSLFFPASTGARKKGTSVVQKTCRGFQMYFESHDLFCFSLNYYSGKRRWGWVEEGKDLEIFASQEVSVRLEVLGAAHVGLTAFGGAGGRTGLFIMCGRSNMLYMCIHVGATLLC